MYCPHLLYIPTRSACPLRGLAMSATNLELSHPADAASRAAGRGHTRAAGADEAPAATPQGRSPSSRGAEAERPAVRFLVQQVQDARAIGY
jgi:hypothetical protein